MGGTILVDSSNSFACGEAPLKNHSYTEMNNIDFSALGICGNYMVEDLL